MLLVALIAGLLAAGPEPVKVQALGRMDAPALREVSGIVASRRHPGVYWVHNDSGNPPRVFAIRADGSLIREFPVNVPNVDWEDIAIDNDGHLFIGDIGNNDNRLPLRAIYMVDEPDPDVDLKGGVAIRRASYYRFAAGGRFDAESLVVDGSRALLVAKTHDRRDAEVYAVPLDPPAPLLRPAVAERVGVLPGFTAAATGADLSRDGRRLVVCSPHHVGVYERAASGAWSQLDLRSHKLGDDIEAVAWDGDDVILAGENRGLYRILARDLRVLTSAPRGRPVRHGQ